MYGRYAVTIVPHSLSHLAYLSICLYSCLSISWKHRFHLANLHQSKASLGEHFKLDNIKFFWQKFVFLNKVVFKTLVECSWC